MAATVLALQATAFAQPASPPLFSYSGGVTAADSALTLQSDERQVARSRRVGVNFENIDPRWRAAPTQLSIELFDGAVLTLEPDRVDQRGPNNYTWHGRVRGFDKSQVILTVVDGQIAGTITYQDVGARLGATFEIRSGPGGAASLREIDPSAFPPDHPDGYDNQVSTQAGAGVTSGPDSAIGGEAAIASGDTGSTIDVMVVYSNQTSTAAGTAIGAQIQNAVDTANAVYANSGIATRLRLVHYERVNYNESGDFVTDLNRLTNATDGYMDNVATLRNTYAADLVSLFVESSQYCGYAWIGANANYGFSVVNRGCASGNYSFVHELGHNFGARHDPYVDASTTPYAYGHGLTDASEGWRTIMAYNDACAKAGTSCTRIPYFSNPNLTYGTPAHPLGTTATNDNTRVHNSNAYTVANFRTAATSGCTYALSPTSASIGSAATNGSISVTAGATCAWNSTSNASWLVIGSNSGTAASGTLYYAAAANSGPSRSASITVGGQAFTVNQASGCTYTLSPTSASVGGTGGTGSFSLTAGAACAWGVTSGAAWLTISSATSGTGNATVTYAVAPNTGALRTGNLTVGGATFVVSQAATSSTPAPIATLSASSIAFGNQVIGTTSGAKNVVLTNTGGGTLTISAMTVGGSNPGDFARPGVCVVGTALSAGGSCTITYTFKPTAAGNRSASLALGTSAGTVTLGLSGKGTRK